MNYDGLWHYYVMIRACQTRDYNSLIQHKWRKLNYELQRVRNSDKRNQYCFDYWSRMLGLNSIDQ